MPTPARAVENEAVAPEERMKLKVIAMFDPKVPDGTEGCEPPKDCEPTKLTPGVVRATVVQLLKSVPTWVPPVVATHIGVPATGLSDPTPPVEDEVMRPTETLPLKRPVIGCVAKVGSVSESANERSEPEVLVTLSEPLCVAKSMPLAAEKL